MRPLAYYNEHDPKAAAWLKILIAEGEIAEGVVDTRSIKDVRTGDLYDFTQHHFFAGIGGWSLALRGAGWPDDLPVWTGSCPCQPFSEAGARGGFADPRHLWPDWFRLIREFGPDRVFGEQVASATAWLDLVRADMERETYAIGAVDLAAAGFGGAHIRQRYYWVADSHNSQRWAEHAPRHVGEWPQAGRLKGDCDAKGRGTALWLDHSSSARPEQERGGESIERKRGSSRPELGRGVNPDWLFCQDNRWRPVEPGTLPLAHEIPARVGRLRGYGNALDIGTATAFVRAYMEALESVATP